MNLLTAYRATVKSLPAEDDERRLAARLARGEPEALDALVERFAPRVTALAARLLAWGQGADDVAQDVFLKVLEQPGKFRGEASLWTYLATITVNRCRTLIRRRWLLERVLQVVAPLRSEHSTASPGPERLETAQAIRDAVARLSSSYREVIVLRYFEELTVDEVAQVLRLKRNAVEVRLSRARKLLETNLGHLSDEV